MEDEPERELPSIAKLWAAFISMVRTKWPVFMTFARTKFREAPPPMQFAVGVVGTMAACATLWLVGWMMFATSGRTKHAERPIISAMNDQLDERMIVVAEEDGGGFVAYRPVIDAVWTGPIDDDLIRNATGVLYERLRTTVNTYLATIHEASQGKLFLRIWLHPQAPDYELAYLRANSGKLAHVIPPWKDAVVEFSWPIDLGGQAGRRRSLDPSSRPGRKDEDLYYAYRSTISRFQQTIKLRDGESGTEYSNRKDIAKAEGRQKFLRVRGLTETQLRRIEAHHYLWTWGEKVTPERIEEYLNPSSVDESP